MNWSGKAGEDQQYNGCDVPTAAFGAHRALETGIGDSRIARLRDRDVDYVDHNDAIA